MKLYRNVIAAALLGAAITGFGAEAVSTVIPPPAVLAAPLAEASSSGTGGLVTTGAAAVPPVKVPVEVNNSKSAEENSATADPPSEDAWKAAPPFAPQRAIGEHSTACKVRQLKQWYNVRCTGLPTSAITQLGGDDSGVHFRLEPAADDGLPREGEVTFSLREAQSRVFSFWTFGDGYDGPLTVMAAVVVQARRHAGATSILLHDALNQPIRTAQSELRRTPNVATPTLTPAKIDPP